MNKKEEKVLKEIYTHRSIRKYEENPISKDVLEQIIDAGRVAPSAKNRQPWKYLVYSGEEKDKLLAVMEKGIEMEEINPRLPVSVSGIPDAKKYTSNYGNCTNRNHRS